ncbi:hypothetical protein CGC20_19540 [Leishmania donovani]|uniref:Uncharacterized protein n=1 Tax=Leishmania donovani TaxID=5661 RepID=A0A504XL80_LEIDO|nr:hypothetical protein CGC20_19540 [Leishmania donovani]
MSFMEEMSDAPVSITGEMWLCADSAGPLKVGAGRGLKNFITIEKDRFCAYSSRSEQSKQIKQIAFRSMKRVAWFTHHPKLPGRELAASTTAATLRRGARKDPLAATYYYLVLEFLRDNTIPGTVSLGKRERIVLCTDDHQDFSIWRKFAELYECPPVHEGFVEGRDKKTLRAQAPAAPWVENADVFDTPASCGGLDWDVHVESVLHAIEQDMRPSMKVVPAHSTRGAAAGPSSLLSSPSIAPSSIHPCAATKGIMETGSDEMHSLASNLQVELEQFQAFAAEVGALVEGRELKTTKISPDALNAYVERLRKMPTPAEPADSVAAQRGDKTEANAGAAAADLAKLESACVNAVRSFREKVHTSVLPLSQEWNREKAEQQERAALPQRVETTVAVLIDELARATADVSTLKESLATSIIPTTVSSATSVPLELNELRRVLNQKELEVETLQQKHFDASRHTKQLSRRLEELVFSYSDVAHDMLRSQYREYASLRNLFLRALRGEVSLDNSTPAEASLGASGSFGGMSEACCSSHLSASSGVQKLVISAAHLEAIHALEQERAAARERQRELEEVVKELEVLRQERDEEIANLKCNFLAAGEAWEKDVAILQAKLSALQSAIPRGALLLPASSLATNTAVKAGIAQKLQSTQPHTPTGPAGALESTETVTPLFAEGHKALHKLTTLLTTTPKETVLEAAVVSQRLQAFYDWALEAVVPLSSTSVSDGSVLEMITNVVHAYHALLQQTSTIYTATKSDTDDTHVDVLRLMRNEHEQFRKLWGILEEHLLIHGAGSFHDSGHQQSSERMALSFSSPPTMEELDQLPPFIETLCTNAALYSKLKIRSGGVPIATYIQDLEKKSAQLEQQLQHKEQEERSLSALIATFQDNNTPLFSSHANSPLAALGADAPASPSVAEAIARAAADAAERERALRAEVAAAEERLQAMEERLEAASAEQQQLQADRDAKLRAADERLAQTAAARQELCDSVADALAALGADAPASPSVAEAIARAAADAAERERALRAEVAAAEERLQAMEERLEAASAEQQQLQADRDAKLRAADERLAQTAAARQELCDSVADALAALGADAPASPSVAEAIARAAADAAERERALRAEVAAAEERLQAMEERLEAASAEQQQLQADRDAKLRAADERLAQTAAARQELCDSVADALAALGADAPASPSVAEAIARAAADAAERERALRAEVAAAEERLQAMEERLEAASAEQQQLQADRDAKLRAADERLAQTAAARQELCDSVADALAALGADAPASPSVAEAIARAAADAAERERALRAEVAAAEERLQAMEERLEAASAEQQQLQADRDAKLRAADERLAQTAAARQELCDSVADALAALGADAPASPSVAEAIARAAADAAERERALRAEVAAAEERLQAMEERLEAASAEQQQLQADRDAKLRAADERLAQTAAARQELCDSVADALAALGADAPASPSVAEAIARAAADAAERERALRAEVAAAEERLQAMEERLEAASAEQQQLQADRDAKLRAADERLRRRRLRARSCATALPTRLLRWAIARAAADAAERERALRAEVAAAEERLQAMEERLEAASAEQQQLQADRDAKLRAADERLAQTAAARQELCDSVADALAALGADAPASPSVAEAIARAAADAAERERALRAEVAAAEERLQAMEERLEAASAEQQQLQADRDAKLRAADERLAQTAAARQELCDSVADALAALGADAPASPSVAEAIARAAADAAERERALRAEVAAAEERLQAMEERLEAASAEQQQLQADRDAKLRAADERLAQTAAARQELCDSVADALAALGADAPASPSVAEAIARAAADAAERERALRAEVAAAEERLQAMEERLEAASAEQQQLQADRDAKLRAADERLRRRRLRARSCATALPTRLLRWAIARAAADAAERERALRAEVAAAEERLQAMEERLEAASAEQQQLQADRDAKLRAADERLAQTAAARQELCDSVADALAALGADAPASPSVAEAIARAAADAAERERALRAEVAAAEERLQAMEERLEAASAEQQQLQADRDAKLRAADERLRRRRLRARSCATALPTRLLRWAIARAAADAAERERALRAEVAAAEERLQAMEERLEAASAEQQQLQADRDAKLRAADERLAQTAAARQELCDSVADALAALGADAPASPSVAEAIARAAADAAERERALRAEVAAAEERLQAMEERLEAASAEQQQLQADRDAKLRDWAEKMLEIRGMVGGSADEVVRRVRELLAELNGLRAFAREAQEKVFWYEDVRVRVPLIKLSDFVRERDGTGECYHRDDAAVPFLAETLRNSFQALQCLDSEALALRESFSSMKALVKECGTAVNESVEALRKALPRAACVENASPSQPQSTLPVEWGLRVACRGLAASVSEAVHWQGELTNIVKATYRILIASSGGTGVHGAPVSHCDNPSFAEYSQLPRLAAQACSERLHSRRSASVEDELAAVTQQRNDLAGTVGACCGSLRSAISVTTPGRVGSLPATATSLTCDEAKSALRDITVLTSSILHDYAQSMEHTLAVLTPLASIAANTADASSSFEMLAAATEAVRARIKHMERCQLHHLHVRQCGEEGNAKARRSMQDQLFALSEVFEAGELARRNEQKEEAVPLADVAQQQQPWDAVVEVLSKFAEDVGATVRAQNGSESQNVDNAEVLSPVRQAISLSASAKTQEELQGRLSGILDACKRRAAEHHWAEATEGRMALDREDLRASVTTGEHSLEKTQAQVNEYQKPMATMEAARAALGQSTTQMQLVAARALEETLDFGLRERAASESGARAPTGMGERLGEEMYLVQPRMDAMQDRLNDTEVRDSSQVMDAGVLLEAAGQVRSLEDVMRIVSSYSLEYKTKSLEFKESRLRSEIVQDWAAMMVPSAIELRLLRAIVAGVDRPLPGTALADFPAHGSSMRRELTEAEHLLGAAVSDPCAEEATREALLGAMGQACQLLLEAPPERALDTAARHGTASSAEECPAVTAADAVSTTDVGRGTAPSKLADTVYAVIEECGDRAAANGTLCTGEEWYSSVARVTQTLCSALSSAGVAVAVPGDHSLMAGHPSCVSPASQPSMLHSLVSAAEHVSKYTTDTTRLLEDLRESLQDCLSSTECCLPTLVAAVVEEVASLRAASQLAAEEQKHRDHELDALRTLLQEASAVFSDTSTFRSTQSPNFLAKCMAYAKECARLTAPECELSSAFGAASAQRSSLEDAPFSLGDRAAELQRDGVELREVEALKLQGLVCTLSVEVLLAEERAARSIMVAEEATSRLHVLCDPQLRELGFLVERVLARAATTEAQCAQKTAQHCSILAAQEPLAITASGLVSVQEDCCRALVESEGDASCAAAPTRFKPETLNILEQEAVLVPRVVQAHGRLTATCAVLRSDLDAAKAVYEQALAEVQAELDIARSRSTELEAHLEHVFDAIEALGSLLFPHEEASLRDASCLPRLAEASGQLVRTAAADAAARCRLEKDACDAAAAFAELQRQCAAAEGNVETLKETVRRYERQEADEIQTLKASAKTAAEAYAGMVTALCLSAELVPSAASAAAAVSEKQWAAVVHAVQAAVEEGGRQTSDAAELRVEMTILQSRMVELKAAVLEAEAREGNLLQRLNALMMSSGPLKAAVTAVMASRECDLESLEDVALAMHAAVQLVERQQGNMNQLIAGGGDLRSDAESLHGRLCGVAEECGVARPSLASLEETHGMLQRRMAQLERHVHDTISTVDRRAAAVLGEAESRRLDKGTPADCLDGIAYLADALACRAEECDAAKAQLLAWRAEARDREEANLRNTTRLSTLWHAFRTALLPQLVDEPADRGGCGEVEVFSADAVEFLASEAETRQAIQMIIDTAERLRRTHDDLQAVYAALRGHFGGDATTAVCDGTATPHAPARALHNSGVTSLRFDDTVTATLHLVSTVVNAKCTSVTEFIDLVVSDVLRDTSGSARVLFATLRPGAFAERLQGVLASLRTLRESSDQHGDRARRLPAFMDALVETIHSHGGRVDVTSSDATGDLTIADATMPYRHDSATTFEDCQAREQRAIVHGLQALLNQQEERARALTAEWQCVTTQYHQLSQEQVAAEETVVELRRRVQFKLQEDSKLEESLRELDSHLDQQARELSMRYFADQDAIVRRFTLLRDQIHAAMRLPTRRSASAIPPRTPGRDTSTPRS